MNSRQLNLSIGVAAIAMLSVSLLSCTRVSPAVQNLPELPEEFAKDLEPASTAPVLISKPAPVTTAKTGIKPPISLKPSKACTSKHDGYVIFPITVCYTPVDLDNLELAGARSTKPTKVGGIEIPPSRFFKLSSHPRSKFRHPLFCHVHHGPWYAHVEGEQKCDRDPAIREFTATLLAAPEPVVVSWSGTLADVPPPLNLIAITFTTEACACCSGVTCPSGECSVDFDHCGVMPPVIQ